jgi:ABC-type multidrug transport system fused ATPase/permease subunit
VIGGFACVVTLFGQGGFRITQKVSRLNYEMFDWLQDIAQNRLHFKATDSMPLLLDKTDALAREYVMARRTRSDILTGRQYKSSVIWQAFGHSSMIALGGWLLSIRDITLGQFVAAEVIVGTLLLNLDTVARRLYAAIYVFTSMDELATLFALPKQDVTAAVSVRLPDPTLYGVRVSCWEVSARAPDGSLLFENVNLEIAPGEKIAVICPTNLAKTTFAMVLAGLYAPTKGVVRYNDIDLRDVGQDYVNRSRGLVLDSYVTLFQGTIEENISLRRPQVRFDDLRWALRFTELEDEIDAMPQGLDTVVGARGRLLTRSQVLRLLVARAIAIRPQFLVFDGSLHDVEPDLRATILRRLCSKEEPWSLAFVSNDPAIASVVERRVTLG